MAGGDRLKLSVSLVLAHHSSDSGKKNIEPIVKRFNIS